MAPYGSIYEGMCSAGELPKGLWEQCAKVSIESIGGNESGVDYGCGGWWQQGEEDVWNVLKRRINIMKKKVPGNSICRSSSLHTR